MKACTFKPKVKGKVSQLYEEIYKKTGRDRKLTNFLYTYSTLSSVKAKFNADQLNIQGEIKFSEFEKFIHLTDILDKKHQIEDVSKTLGALDSTGNVVMFDTIDDALNQIGTFNKTQEDYVATVKKKRSGYYIEVEVKNASNFLTQFKVDQKVEKFQEITTAFNNAGFNTTFTPEEQQLINIDNLRFYNVLKSLQPAVTYYINRDVAKILIALNRNSIWYPRLVASGLTTDEEIAHAIATYTGAEILNPYAWASAAQQDLIKNFLYGTTDSIKSKVNTIDFVTLSNTIATISDRKYTGVTVYDTDGQTMHDVLKDLYSKFGINHDVINGKQTQITKISELLHKLNSLAEKRAIKIEKAIIEDKKLYNGFDLVEEQAKMETGQYISAMAEILTSLYHQISESAKWIDALQDADNTKYATSKLSDEDKHLIDVKNKAIVINNTLQLIQAVKDILPYIDNFENFEQDVELTETDPVIKDALLNLIKRLNTGDGNLNQIEQALREQQFNIIHAFLKVAWGDADVKTIAGVEETTLSSVIKDAIFDPTFADTLVNAIANCNDPMIALVGEMMTIRHRVRDAKLRDIDFKIRVATEKLTQSGSKSDFMYVKDSDGNVNLLMPYDPEAYRKAKESFLSTSPKPHEIEKWIEDNTETITLTHTIKHGSKEYTYSYEEIVPRASIYPSAIYNSLTAAQKEYYQTMMEIKAAMQSIAPTPNFSLQTPIQMSADMINAINEAKGDSQKIKEIMKNEFLGALGVQRADDVGYRYAGGNVVRADLDLFGNEVKRIPIYFTGKLENQDALTTDFSRALTNYAATALEFEQLHLMEDAVLMCQDYAISQRNYSAIRDDRPVGYIENTAGVESLVVAYDQKKQARVATMFNELLDKYIYLRYAENEVNINVGDTKINVNKLAGNFVALGSVLGLGLNILGGETNYLIGKIQMIIESGCSEFFNWKDMVWADAEYGKLLLQGVSDLNSENTKSLLTLLMNHFNVTNNLKDKIAKKHYSKDMLNRLFNNTSLLFMYEAGEHALHAETMLAILHRNKCLSPTGEKVPLFEAFGVNIIGNNGELIIKPGYKTLTGEDLTLDNSTLLKIEKQMKYCNNTMHGSLGEDDKGFIHRRIWGKFVMNFRQWMVGHYTRRFGERKHNFELEEDREGYYITCMKFLANVVMDSYYNRGKIIKAFKENKANLSSMEIANMKRALTETALLIAAHCTSMLLGAPDKSNRGKWLRRHLQYLNGRLLMELEASTPVAGVKFGGSLMTQLNSPFAAMSTMSKIFNLFRFGLLFEEVQTGKYAGENMYWHKNKKAIPFYQQLHTLYNLDEDEYAFTLFTKSEYR